MFNDFIQSLPDKSTFFDFPQEFFCECSSEIFSRHSSEIFFEWSSEIFSKFSFSNCTKSGRANAEIFSEFLEWWIPTLIRSIGTISIFFPGGQFGVFRTYFRNKCGKIWKFIKILCCSRIFFSNSELPEYSEFYFPSKHSEFPATGSPSVCTLYPQHPK